MKTTLVIFGITGDLSRRKLLPALQSIIARNTAGELSVIGVSRSPIDVGQLLKDTLGDDSLSNYFVGHTMDLAQASQYKLLKSKLPKTEPVVIYLAVPPASATQIVDFLGEAGINTPNVKILFEKPFGYDLDSARQSISRTARYFDEEHIYRIDHYMAKEVALELVRLRFDATHEYHAWNNTTIKQIEVLAHETIGIEGRAAFYEQVGALRDVVQGHLMQLLSLVLMKLPKDFSLVELPRLRHKALKFVNPVLERSIRAQYDNYQQEVDNQGSLTETFVRIELTSDDPDWQGVPIILTTGKSMDRKKTAVKVTMKDGSVIEFDEEDLIRTKDFVSDAYERVFTEAIESRHNIFTSSDEVLESWRILEPIRSRWSMDDSIAKYTTASSVDQIADLVLNDA